MSSSPLLRLRKFRIPRTLACLACLLAGCGGGSAGPSTESPGKPTVIAVSYPLASIALRLGGDAIELNYPVPAEEDSLFWSPGEDDVLAMQGVDLLLLNGAGHEPWEEQVSLSPLTKAVTAQGFRDQWIEQEDAVTHKHGPEGEHTHAGLVATTWLDPLLFREQIQVVQWSLVKLLPNQREVIEERTEQASRELQAVHERWEQIRALLGDQPLIASHPVYHYLARRYGWNVRNEHWEPDEDPTAEQWQAFDELLKMHPAKIMIWEDEPTPATREQLATRGIQVLVLPTLASGSPMDEVIGAMSANAAHFEAELRKGLASRENAPANP